MELSLGLNDWQNKNMKSYLNTILQRGIDTYLAAKPDAHIVLVTPIPISSAGRGSVYDEIYSALASKNNLPLIDSSPPLKARQDEKGNELYYDGWHPNSRGSHLLIDYLFAKMMTPSTYKKARTQYDDSAKSEELWKSSYLVLGSYLSSGAGTLVKNEKFTATDLIPVIYGATYRFTWQGNRTGLVYYNANKEPIRLHYEHAEKSKSRFFSFTRTDSHMPYEIFFSIHEKYGCWILIKTARLYTMKRALLHCNAWIEITC